MNDKAVAKELVAAAKELMAVRMVHRRELYRPNPKNTQNAEEIKVPNGIDLEIWRYEMDGRLFGVAFQGKSQKPLWQYRFRDEAQFNKYVKDKIESRQEQLKDKKKRVDERNSFKHELTVGTILYSSWGYDQTNIDYYEVIKATEKSVTVREIGSKVHHSGMGAEYVVAAPGKFKGSPMTKRVRPGNSIRITSYASAYVWDGKPQYETAMGWGH